ncbi:MAG: tRNA (adenosine(37)-N6)-threonylcarbamoyltransferase complex ATPase subunit type 1 TsaE [Thermoanaerobaculia bacterium]|nr:tRNA (adenosine(37)-N6)-threonylcarbamoyltransferase complex ATPase subunit type 1 TsaE [Thermoanaerobaculia bacterium]
MRTVPFEAVARSVEETREVGRELSLLLVPGSVVRLSGPLGAGKTELVRGLAEGLGILPDEVASPTFALVHEYGPEGRPPLLVHVDFYRLLDDERLGAAIEGLGLDETREDGSVVVVEWPEGLPATPGDFEVIVTPERDGARRIEVRRAPVESGSRGGLRRR